METTTTTQKKQLTVVPTNNHIVKDLGPEIVAEAKKWLHVREIGNNAGFNDKDFEAGLKAVGWIKGQPWCAYFTKFIYLRVYERYEPGLVEELKKMLTGHVLTNVKNSKKNQLFPLTQKFVLGGIVGWRVGSGTSGHCGIGVRLHGTEKIVTIDGNTDGAGSREGNGIFEKTRTINTPNFQFRGIIKPRTVMVYENAQPALL